LTEPEVVADDIDIDSQYQETDGGRRRWSLLLAVAVLVLLLFCCVTSSDVWVSGGREQARFVAENIECLQCHTERIPDFNRTSVHNPFMHEDCTACHTRHGKKVTVSVATAGLEYFKRTEAMLRWLPLRWWFSLTRSSTQSAEALPGETTEETSQSVKGADSTLILPEQELCWTCHGSMGKKLGEMFQHQPFEAGRCSNCHDPHASNHQALLLQEPDRLCFTCHPIGMEIGRSQAHPPAKNGLCLDCHDPHASDYQGILVDRQRELCFRCHPTVAVKNGMAVQHAPFLNDNCTGCHEPHGSDTRPLLNAPQPELCYECHPGIQNEFAQPSHHPVGVDLECDDCHDPHASQFDGLVSARSNDFCYGCHKQIRASFEDSDHGDRLCIRCHTPHGSNFAPMLVDRNPDLCLQCHPDSQYDRPTTQGATNKHPVRPNHYDVNNESPLTCSSSCHNPHGSDKSHMLRYFDSPYDGGCLMCHAVTEGSRVGIDY